MDFFSLFSKISSTDFSLPKDKIQELARLLDTDINRLVNQLKSIVLWDNLATSAVVSFFCLFYYLFWPFRKNLKNFLKGLFGCIFGILCGIGFQHNYSFNSCRFDYFFTA